MRNLPLTSHEADEKVSLFVLCAGLAACVGLSIPLPFEAEDYIRLFDAVVCSLFSITAWAAYHLLAEQFSIRRKAIAAIGAILLWISLTVGLAVLLRTAHFDVGLTLA